MSRVFKYHLGNVDIARIMMPASAQILSVQVQRGVPQIWAVVDDDEPEVLRTFKTVGTGWNFEGLTVYWGTYQLHEGDLVFHVFEDLAVSEEGCDKS
jgi:hypothetical protein